MEGTLCFDVVSVCCTAAILGPERHRGCTTDVSRLGNPNFTFSEKTDHDAAAWIMTWSRSWKQLLLYEAQLHIMSLYFTPNFVKSEAMLMCVLWKQSYSTDNDLPATVQCFYFAEVLNAELRNMPTLFLCEQSIWIIPSLLLTVKLISMCRNQTPPHCSFISFGKEKKKLLFSECFWRNGNFSRQFWSLWWTL